MDSEHYIVFSQNNNRETSDHMNNPTTQQQCNKEDVLVGSAQLSL